jgi:hypothetical protein
MAAVERARAVREDSALALVYEWWEAPEFLAVVRPAQVRSQLAVH